MYRDSGGYFSKPVVTPDGAIQVGALNGCLYTFNPNGVVRWKYPAGGTIHSDPVRAADGSLFFGSKNKYVHALNADGTLRWRCQVDGPVEAGATLGPDGTVYFATMKGSVFAFDQKDALGKPYNTFGKKNCDDAPLLWHLKLPKGSQKVKFTPIVVEHDGTKYIIVGNEKGGKRALGLMRIRDNGTSGELVNSLPEGAGGAFRIGGVVSGPLLYTSAYNEIMAVRADLSEKEWGYPIKQVHRSHPVLSPDKMTVYQGSREAGDFVALNALSGEERWRVNLESGVVMTPAVDPVDGTIYVGQASGGPFFFALNPDGSEKWRSDTDRSLRSTPAISNNRAVVYTGGNVGPFFALDAATGEMLWSQEVTQDKKFCGKMQ